MSPLHYARLAKILSLLSAAPAGLSTISSREATVASALAIDSYEQPDSGACVLVVHGAGSRFTDDAIDNVWHEVNVAIARALVQQLPSAGYAAESLTIPRKGRSVMELLVEALPRTGCDRLLEIRHRIGVDSAGSFFAFDVRVIPATANPGRSSYQLGDVAFQQSYRFARTDEELERFTMSVFATSLLADLIAARALARS